MEIMVGKRMKQVLMLIFSASVLASGQAFAQQRNDYGGWGMWPGMMWGFPMGWFAMIFMSIFWIAAIVGLIFLVRWLVQSTRGSKDTGFSSSRALDILKERYAKGEIDKEEFDRMKKDITG